MITQSLWDPSWLALQQSGAIKIFENSYFIVLLSIHASLSSGKNLFWSPFLKHFLYIFGQTRMLNESYYSAFSITALNQESTKVSIPFSFPLLSYSLAPIKK